MTKEDILRLRDLGEQTTVQFKERITSDNKSIIWVKQGADKRRVFDNTELANMMMESHRISLLCH